MNEEQKPTPDSQAPASTPAATPATAAPAGLTPAAVPPSDATPPSTDPIPEEAPKGPENLSDEVVWDALRKVVDPELHYNIVDLGLVYGITVRKPDVHVDMTLTSPGCPYGPLIVHDVKTSIGSAGAENVSIDIVWDPPWGPDKMSEEANSTWISTTFNFLPPSIFHLPPSF